MSENHPEEINYGKKAGCVAWFFIYFALFIILLIWIYHRNGDSLPL
jgi:hypothetical protein